MHENMLCRRVETTNGCILKRVICETHNTSMKDYRGMLFANEDALSVLKTFHLLDG
jgi:hypothetical protein